MRKTKTYQNNSPLDYGFILNAQSKSNPSLMEVCSKAKTSITLVDTADYILDSFLKDCINILNERRVVVAGLVSKRILSTLESRGVRTGFFRSTDVRLGLGLLIIDKKEVWACFGEGRILRILDGSEEVFQYVNHLLWTKTDHEYSFGENRVVKETMLSVVAPKPSVGIALDAAQHIYASEGLASEKGLLVKEPGEYTRPAMLMPLDCKAFTNQDGLYVEIIPDAFYGVDDGMVLAEGISFDPGTKPSDLLGKEIFYKGRKCRVQERENLNRTIYVPLDEVAGYEPDFDAIYAERKEIALQTDIEVEVLPMKRDESYQLASNYRKKEQIQKGIDEALSRLEKFDLVKETKKQIATVRSEKLFAETVRLYNQLVNELDYGVDALKNEKNRFSSINESKEDFATPHELLGTLLQKGGTTYLALKDEKKVGEAKAWLKDNGIEAILIAE